MTPRERPRASFFVDQSPSWGATFNSQVRLPGPRGLASCTTRTDIARRDKTIVTGRELDRKSRVIAFGGLMACRGLNRLRGIRLPGPDEIGPSFSVLTIAKFGERVREPVDHGTTRRGGHDPNRASGESAFEPDGAWLGQADRLENRIKPGVKDQVEPSMHAIRAG